MIWENYLLCSKIFNLTVLPFVLIAAIDCGHPLLLHTGAVFLPVFALFSIHRHQKEGKNDSINKDDAVVFLKRDSKNQIIYFKLEIKKRKSSTSVAIIFMYLISVLN